MGVRLHWGCLVDGCENPHAATGYCSKHYARIRHNGTPFLDGHGETFVDRTPPPAFICAENIDRAYLAISLERPGETGLILTRNVK